MKLWSSLLFLHGHIADPVLARSLAGDDTPQAAPRPHAHATARHTAPPRPGPLAWLLHNLAFLGGRPMTAGHNDDIDEPFPRPATRAPQRPCVPFKRGAITAAACSIALSPFR